MAKKNKNFQKSIDGLRKDITNKLKKIEEEKNTLKKLLEKLGSLEAELEEEE